MPWNSPPLPKRFFPSRRATSHRTALGPSRTTPAPCYAEAKAKRKRLPYGEYRQRFPTFGDLFSGPATRLHFEKCHLSSSPLFRSLLALRSLAQTRLGNVRYNVSHLTPNTRSSSQLQPKVHDLSILSIYSFKRNSELLFTINLIIYSNYLEFIYSSNPTCHRRLIKHKWYRMHRKN